MNFKPLGKLWIPPWGRMEASLLVNEIFEASEYLRYGITLKPKDVVFDVGANIGIFSIFANQQSKGEISLFAFEPVPQSFQLLKKNLSLHGIQGSTIRVFNLGLSDSQGGASLTYFPFMPSNSTLKPFEKGRQLQHQLHWALNPFRVIQFVRRSNPILAFLLLSGVVVLFPFISLAALLFILPKYQSKQIPCEMTTLSQICDEHRVEKIDLLKLDVEGSELEVLQGIRENHWSQIKQIVMEVHPLEDRLEKVQEILSKKGFCNITTSKSETNLALGIDNVILYATRDILPG